MDKYEIVIGLEVHVQLLTESKAFCGCSTKFGLPPNSATCPVCLGLPGVLPVLNKKAFFLSLKTALALNCSMQRNVKFDRKNYYYPDLPKNYQISQYDMPLAYDGYLEIETGPAKKKIRIKRVHLEEDAGKLMHDQEKGLSYVDLNRAGTPLLEIVSEPDIRSPEETGAYLEDLKAILQYLQVSDCNMEEASLRCDANISVRVKGQTSLGTKAELKNMNSFKAVKNALNYEAARQVDLLEKNEKILQETRLWSETEGRTIPMRTKEETEDYRYFPEPDLAPFTVDQKEIDALTASLPELPKEKKKRFISQYSLSEYDAGSLTRDFEIARFFEEAAAFSKDAKQTANWLLGDVASILNEKKTAISKTPFKPAHLAELLSLIRSDEISGKMAKDILPEIFEKGVSPKELVEKKGLRQIKDTSELSGIIRQVINENKKSREDYKKGKKNALMFLIGQVMRKTKGKANPKVLNDILVKMLEEET